MIRKLGFVPAKESKEGWAKYAQTKGQFEQQLQETKQETKQANSVISDLKMRLMLAEKREALPHPVVDMGMEDPEPSDIEQRKLFVGQAAGFHTDILKKKILALISDARGQFEQINRNTFGLSQGEYDLFLKGTLNGLWLVHDWGEEMVNEVLSYQTENQEFSEEDKQSLQDKLQG